MWAREGRLASVSGGTGIGEKHQSRLSECRKSTSAKKAHSRAGDRHLLALSWIDRQRTFKRIVASLKCHKT
jgi:hypothetical protein